jgi:gluconokinase
MMAVILSSTNFSQRTIVVIGPAGSGKTTVARVLAEATGRYFIDADDLHTEACRRQMRSGSPLSPTQRKAFLTAVADRLGEEAGRREGLVLACSALGQEHRRQLLDSCEAIWFAQLVVDPVDLATRLRTRRGHFFPAELLPDQLRGFEPLTVEEPGACFDGASPPTELCAAVMRAFEEETHRA